MYFVKKLQVFYIINVVTYVVYSRLTKDDSDLTKSSKSAIASLV